MLSIAINVTKRDNRLGTASGTVTLKMRGVKPVVCHFESSPHQVYIKGLGGDRIHERGMPGGCGSMYGAVGAAAIELFCHAQQVQLEEAGQDVENMTTEALNRIAERLVQFS